MPSNPFDLFPKEVNEAIDGLMWLGHLETVVTFCGHEFVLRTLKADEELAAGLLAKEYLDSYGQIKANAWAHIAAALVSVDGEENFSQVIGPGKQEALRSRFGYITQNWYWPTGAKLFGAYTELVLKQTEAIRAIEDLS